MVDGAYGGEPPSDFENELEEQGGDQQDLDDIIHDSGSGGKKISMISHYYEKREIGGNNKD